MGVPAIAVYLPPAVTIGDRVGVRLAPVSPHALSVWPDGTDDINGLSMWSIGNVTTRCLIFIVGEVGHWWVERWFDDPPE